MKRTMGNIHGLWRAYYGFNGAMLAIFIAFVIVFYSITEDELLHCQQGSPPVLTLMIEEKEEKERKKEEGAEKKPTFIPSHIHAHLPPFVFFNSREGITVQ